MSLTDGLIFAGPGLPARINRHLAAASAPTRKSVQGDDAPHSAPQLQTRLRKVGVGLLTGTGLLTAFAGATYLFLAAARSLLPPEAAHLHLGSASLRAADHSRILDFIAHGRACYGGTLLGLGFLWVWLSIRPVNQREDWAWWTMLLAGGVFFGAYCDFSPMDIWNLGARRSPRSC